jgi:hypothetical protein
MWRWRRLEKISWTDRVNKEKRSILHAIQRRKANWIGHILLMHCLLKHVIEGKLDGRTQVMERLGRIRKQLLGDLKETREHCKLNEEALDRFGRGCGTVEKHTAE